MHGRNPAITSIIIALLCASTASAEITSLTVPTVAVTRTGDALVLAAETFDAPALNGTLEAADTITLAADGGTLTLASTDGLSLVGPGGNNSGSLSFTAVDTDAANAALNGLTITPPAGFAGAITVTLTVAGADTVSDSWRVAVNALLDSAEARTQLLAGVTSVHSGVQPGKMVAYGVEAYDIAWYTNNQAQGPMIAAASWGAGRVVAMGDHQMMNMGTYSKQSGAFYTNAVTWLTGTDDTAVSIVTSSQSVADWLAGQGYVDVTVTDEAGLAADLSGADLYVPPWLGSGEPAANLEAIGDYVRGGGALMMVDYGVGYKWWWGKPVYNAPGNKLLREAGIGFTGEHRWDTGTLDVTAASGQVTSSDLIAMLKDKSGFSAGDLARGATLFGAIYDPLSPDDPLVKTLDALFDLSILTISPGPSTPVGDAWDQSLLKREQTLLENTPVTEVTKHRTADAVFGAVPDDAPRVVRTVSVDPKITRWHSTGVYAAPGEVVTVTVPADAVGKGIKLRINGCTDNIGGKGTWMRMPKVSRSFSADAETVLIASPYGGAVYVDVGTKNTELAPFDVTIDGAVDAPFFVLGETTDAQWLGGIRDNPAPYAELVAPGLQISLPSKFIAQLEKPTELMTFWNAVVNNQDALANHGYLRTNGERINIDVQISVGYLHSGYPTQGPHSAGAQLGNPDGLKKSGSWGWFHELGHESQRRPDKSWGYANPYTFDGSVECTVNLFTTYAYDAMEPAPTGGWAWTGSRVGVMKQALNGLPAQTYASVGVGVKLAMFLQLKNTWTWAPLTSVITQYNEMAKDDLPGSDQEKRDELLIRYSNAVGHDMTAFMRDTWGLVISESAADSVATLPDWMPAIGGLEGQFATQMGTPISFDLAGTALSHDGVADITAVTQGAHGAVTTTGDGTWTYTPADKWTGVDSFDYTVTSSTGHDDVTTVMVNVSNHGVLMERWFGIGGTAISSLTGSADYPDNPGDSAIVPSFKAPTNVFDSYGVRMRAFLVAPDSGDYTFWIASDDNGELWLSTDHTAANAAKIATVPGWSSAEQWNKYAQQKSAPVALQKGEVYYIEALMKEGGGGDNLAVAWSPTPDSPTVIGGADLRLYRDENTAPEAVQDSATVHVGEPTTLEVLANDSDADGDAIYLLSVDGAGPDIAVNDDGTLTITGADAGPQVFTYTVADGYGGKATATVTLNVVYADGPGWFEHASPENGAAVDTLMPRVCWTAAEAGAAPLATYAVAFVDANDNEVDVVVDAPELCARPAKPLTVGDWSWLTVAVDDNDKPRAAGLGTPWSLTLSPDTTAPELVVQTPLEGASQGCAAISATGTATDTGSGVASVELRLDGGAWKALLLGGAPTDDLRTWSWTMNDPEDGDHVLAVRTTDGEGNTSAETAVSFNIDCAGPVVSIFAPAKGAYSDGCVGFEWQGSDPAGIMKYSVVITDADGAETTVDAGVATEATLAGDACLPAGVYTWLVHATDTYGNVSETASQTLTVDKTGPAEFALLAQDPLGDDAWTCNGGSVTVSWAAAQDAGAGLDALPYEVWQDGVAAPRTDATTATLTDLTDGQHTWTVRAYDVLGNWTEATATAPLGGFGIDCTAPVVAQVFGGRVTSADVPDQPLATGLDVSEGDTVSVFGRGGLCFSASPACDAEYADDTACVSPVGSDEGEPHYADLTFGALTTIIEGAEDAPVEAGISATFEAASDGQVLLATNSAAAGVCGSLWFQAAVHVGPGFGPKFPADGHLSSNPEQKFEWTAPEDDGSGIATVALLLDGEATPDATQPLPDGEHTWQLVATDNAGNEAAGPVWTVTIDTTPPEPFDLTAPADGEVTNGQGQAFCWADAQDEHSGIADYLVFVDGEFHSAVAGDTTCTAPMDLDEGEHCVEIIARDRLRHERKSGTRCITVDAAAPNPAPLLEPKDGACLNTADVTLSWGACADDGSGIATLDVLVDGESVGDLATDATSTTVALDEGEHTWTVRCTDGAGLPAEAAASLTVDRTGPQLDAVSISDDQEVTIEATDAGCGVADVTVAVDDGDPESAVADATTWRATLAGIEDGEYTLTISAADAAGNLSAATLEFGAGDCWRLEACDLATGSCGTAIDCDPTTDTGDPPIEPTPGEEADSGCQRAPEGSRSGAPLVFGLLLLLLLGRRAGAKSRLC